MGGQTRRCRSRRRRACCRESSAKPPGRPIGKAHVLQRCRDRRALSSVRADGPNASPNRIVDARWEAWLILRMSAVSGPIPELHIARECGCRRPCDAYRCHAYHSCATRQYRVNASQCVSCLLPRLPEWLCDRRAHAARSGHFHRGSRRSGTASQTRSDVPAAPWPGNAAVVGVQLRSDSESARLQNSPQSGIE